MTGSSWLISDIIWTLETAGSLRMFAACSACPSVNCSDKNQNRAIQRCTKCGAEFERSVARTRWHVVLGGDGVSTFTNPIFT